MLALLLFGLLQVPDSIDEKLRALMSELRSDDIAVREKATKGLVELGLDAVPRLEKLRDGSDGEIRARLDEALRSLQREAKFKLLCPPARLVTLSAQDRPLDEVLGDLSAQSGIKLSGLPVLAKSSVTFDSKNEPLFQALDRLCTAHGDLSYDVGDGRIRFSRGKPRAMPVAYAGAYRASLKRVSTHTVNDFGASRTDMVLYLQLDALPDQKHLRLAATSAKGGDAFPLKAATESRLASIMVERTDRYMLMVDDVPVVIESGETMEGVYILKNVAPGVKTIPSVTVRGMARFPLGSAPTTIALVQGQLATDRLKLPFMIMNSGQHVFITSMQTSAREPFRPLEEILQLDSLVVITKEGKEIPMVNQTRQAPGMRMRANYQFVASEGDLRGDGLSLRFNLVDLVDRELEFELKDVKLRD